MINIFFFILILIFKLIIFVWRVVGCSKEFIGPNCALSLKKIKIPVLVLHVFILFANTIWLFSIIDRGAQQIFIEREEIPLLHGHKIYIKNNWILHTMVMARHKREVAKRLVHWYEVMSTCTIPTLRTDGTWEKGSNFWAQRTTLSLRLMRSRCRYSEHNFRRKIAASQHYSVMMLSQVSGWVVNVPPESFVRWKLRRRKDNTSKPAEITV